VRTVRTRSARLPKAWRRLVDDEQRLKAARRRVRHRVLRAPLTPADSAQAVGLRYVSDAKPGIRRIGHKVRVRYVDADGRTIADKEILQRIRSLAIPPAWTDVWICPHPLGHLQATGRDARRRKQYRYHPRWREVRDEVKYGRLLAFADALPRIRERAAADLAQPGLPRNKVVAAVVQLLEKTLIRVGNDEYARDNRSYGLTTLRDEHARVNGTAVRFSFRGKSGIAHTVELQDRRLSAIVKACRELPGHDLFQYQDDDGTQQAIGSADVNEYLKMAGGQDFTAKDFRTWAGTVLVAQALAAASASPSKTAARRVVVQAIKAAAERLGNTQSVCRKCYIHPAILDAYFEGRTIAPRRGRSRSPHALSRAESAVVALLRARLPSAR